MNCLSNKSIITPSHVTSIQKNKLSKKKIAENIFTWLMKILFITKINIRFWRTYAKLQLHLPNYQKLQFVYMCCLTHNLWKCHQYLTWNRSKACTIRHGLNLSLTWLDKSNHEQCSWSMVSTIISQQFTTFFFYLYPIYMSITSNLHS